MIKRILLFVLLLIIIAAGVGYYQWNKPHPTPHNGIAVSAENLAKEYNTDEKASDTKYLNKTLEVTGVVSSISKNQDSALVITLDSGDPMAEIQCTMADKAAVLSKGARVTIAGFCKGNNMGVVLTDCVLK